MQMQMSNKYSLYTPIDSYVLPITDRWHIDKYLDTNPSVVLGDAQENVPVPRRWSSAIVERWDDQLIFM